MNYVLYRLPHESVYTVLRQTQGEPEDLHSYTDIGVSDGFVFAPFSITEHTPILLLKPDVIERHELDDECEIQTDMAAKPCGIKTERAAYHDVFGRFHSRLANGDFDKIVLSRLSTVNVGGHENPEVLFKRACRLYPRMFIALVSMDKAGTWLMATPEILLENEGFDWRTIALAGTMRLTDEQMSFDTPECSVSQDAIQWSDKNIREQRYVASFIRDKLEDFATDINEIGPYTARAGRLVHLRSDFKFRLRSVNCVGRLIENLHPTPAVCGMPRRETYDFICRNEGYDRKYYSGFAGVVSRVDGTHLYVTLRCMSISDAGYSLYAGGGLLHDSVEETEWAETEAKMDTMRKCFAIKKI